MLTKQEAANVLYNLQFPYQRNFTDREREAIRMAIKLLEKTNEHKQCRCGGIGHLEKETDKRSTDNYIDTYTIVCARCSIQSCPCTNEIDAWETWDIAMGIEEFKYE